MRLCAISVDLDEIPNYFAIHAMDPREAPPRTLSAVYDIAVGRLLDFASEEEIPLTFFAIGSDLVRPEARAELRRAHDAGHEIANHTLDHRYDLTRLGRDLIARQVRGGIRAIEEAVGDKPTGFRAPGYTITDEVFDVLVECGVQYDSSVFPCPAYWATKAAAIGLYRARGQESRSIIDTPSVLRAPIRPYFVGRPYYKRGTGLLELPIGVTPKMRLPFIGTALTVAGPTGARKLAEMCVGEPLVNLELHGIDVLDERDGLEPLASHQADVRIVKERKLAALRAVVSLLRLEGYEFCTLQTAATKFA